MKLTNSTITTVKTVGELKSALEGVDDSTSLYISASGYDFESGGVVSVSPDDCSKGMLLDIHVKDGVVGIYNSDERSMVYDPCY